MSEASYNKGYAAYVKAETAGGVCRALRCTDQTAQKLIHYGLPSQGFPAYHERLLRVRAQAQAEEDASLVEVRKQAVKSTQALLALLDQHIEEIAVPDDLDFKTAATLRLEAQRQLVRLLGGEDALVRVEVGPFEGWTYDERLEFARTRRIPEKLRRPVDTYLARGGGVRGQQ